MATENTSPESRLRRFVDEGTERLTDSDALQHCAVDLLGQGLSEHVEAFFTAQLGKASHPLDRAVCRQWIRVFAMERGDNEAVARLAEAQVGDLLEGERPESAASEAAVAAAAYHQAGWRAEARMMVSRGYECLQIAEADPGDMSPDEAAVARLTSKRLLDDVRVSIGQ